MAQNIEPIFTLTPNCTGVTINAANTARDGSGSNFFTVFTAGVNNSLLFKITFTSNSATVGATAAKVMRIWVTDTSGNNPKLRGEIVLPAVTSTNAAIGSTATFNFTDGLPLKSGQLVKVTQSLAATAADYTDAFPEGGDY